MRVTHAALVAVGVLAAAFALAGCGSDTVQVNEVSNLPPSDQLFAAATAGDVAKIQSLLSADPNLVNARWNGGQTPLHAAAAAGQNEAVKVLMAAGANPMVEDDTGTTPLSAANGAGHGETGKLMEAAMNGQAPAPAQP